MVVGWKPAKLEPELAVANASKFAKPVLEVALCCVAGGGAGDGRMDETHTQTHKEHNDKRTDGRRWNEVCDTHATTVCDHEQYNELCDSVGGREVSPHRTPSLHIMSHFLSVFLTRVAVEMCKVCKAGGGACRCAATGWAGKDVATKVTEKVKALVVDVLLLQVRMVMMGLTAARQRRLVVRRERENNSATRKTTVCVCMCN